MTACTLAPEDKKAYISAVGKTLLQRHGKRKFYSPTQVRQASQSSKFDIDWHCWAVCVFSAADDFNAYHQALGEDCDYLAMRAEMACALTAEADISWLDEALSWLDWPNLELPSLFDLFD